MRIPQGSVLGLTEPAVPAAAAARVQTARRPRAALLRAAEEHMHVGSEPRLELQRPETPDANCPLLPSWMEHLRTVAPGSETGAPDVASELAPAAAARKVFSSCRWRGAAGGQTPKPTREPPRAGSQAALGLPPVAGAGSVGTGGHKPEGRAHLSLQRAVN